MKYIKLYEAFESDTISRVISFLQKKVGKDSSMKFLYELKKMVSNLDVPIGNIKDSDIKYTGTKRALNISAPDGYEMDIFCLKFFFSLDGEYNGVLGSGKNNVKFNKSLLKTEKREFNRDKINNSDYDIITDEIGLTTGRLERVKDYSSLKTGDVLVGLLGGSRYYLVKFTIFKSAEDNYIYGIHNNPHLSGGSPWGTEWRKFGRYSWSLGLIVNDTTIQPGHDHGYLYKYTPSDKPLEIDGFVIPSSSENLYDVFSHNFPLSDGNLYNWNRDNINLLEKILNSSFSIVVYLDDIDSLSTIRKNRKDNRSGALAIRKDIRKENIDRYLSKILDKRGISPNMDFNNLQNFIVSAICGDYSSFVLNSYVPSIISNLIDGLSDILELSSEVDGNHDQLVLLFMDIQRKYKNYFMGNDGVKSRYVDGLSYLKRFLSGIKNGEKVIEYLDAYKDIGVYMNKSISSMDINTLEDLMFVNTKLKYINDIMNSRLLKPNRTLSRMLDSITDISSINHNSILSMDVGVIESEIEKAKKLKGYVESLL